MEPLHYQFQLFLQSSEDCLVTENYVMSLSQIIDLQAHLIYWSPLKWHRYYLNYSRLAFHLHF